MPKLNHRIRKGKTALLWVQVLRNVLGLHLGGGGVQFIIVTLEIALQHFGGEINIVVELWTFVEPLGTACLGSHRVATGGSPQSAKICKVLWMLRQPLISDGAEEKALLRGVEDGSPTRAVAKPLRRDGVSGRNAVRCDAQKQLYQARPLARAMSTHPVPAFCASHRVFPGPCRTQAMEYQNNCLPEC
ncbi:hypothetical protein B0H14DRAFT_2565609 [Mycena olivaceomarginata]|nr:hypothetical protein B0H14DRAFT_2565609 [Mycena olivaceomarginata]